jgi:predicted aconitase
MQIVTEAASIYSADRLVGVTKAHIDGCIYTGNGGLAFAERLRDWGGSVVVPTTLNAISVDQRRWRTQGVDERFGVPASRLAEAYVEMGAMPTFTCAPYLLDARPQRDEQVVWAESNAVVYANSVLGARTMKYPDYLDICIALTGRAPLAGCHLDEGRLPQMVRRVITASWERRVLPALRLLCWQAGGQQDSFDCRLGKRQSERRRSEGVRGGLCYNVSSPDVPY